MLSYIFVVAVLNLGMGFALAAYLGRRYRSMMEADDTLGTDYGIGQADSGVVSFAQDLAATTETPADRQAEPSPDERSVEPIADASAAEPAVEPAVEPSAGRPADAAPTAARPPQPERADSPQGDRESDAETSPSEASVRQLQKGVEQYHEELSESDEQLRANVESPDAEAIEACLDSLMQATEEYLDNRGEAYRTFREIHDERPEFETVNNDLQTAIEQQDEQIESASAAVETFDYEGDLKDGCQNMVDETGKLIDGNHRLRDTLDEAMVKVAQTEQRTKQQTGKAGPAAQSDSPKGITDRAGVEARLSQWWQGDPQRQRQLSAAMIEIDQFAKINEQYGRRVSTQILRTMAQILEAENCGDGTLSRLSGQRFLYLFPDADVRFTTNLAERIRQLVEMCHFHYQEFDIQVTVSCAVIESVSEDTTDTLIARAETTLTEAKRYGHNRTFLHEGKHPTPVVPPNFSLVEKHINV